MYTIIQCYLNKTCQLGDDFEIANLTNEPLKRGKKAVKLAGGRLARGESHGDTTVVSYHTSTRYGRV